MIKETKMYRLPSNSFKLFKIKMKRQMSSIDELNLKQTQKIQNQQKNKQQGIKKQLNKFKTNSNKSNFISSAFLNILSQQQWKFISQEQIFHCTKLIYLILQSKCKHILVQNINCQKLFHSLSVPKLSQLIIIRLINCNITNIQNTRFLDAPMLEELNLRNNRISSLKSSVKWKFQHLKNINMSQNYIQQYDQLGRTKLYIVGQKIIQKFDYTPIRFVLRRGQFASSQKNNARRCFYKFNTKKSNQQTQLKQEDQIIKTMLFIQDMRCFVKFEFCIKVIKQLKIENCEQSLIYPNYNRKISQKTTQDTTKQDRQNQNNKNEQKSNIIQNQKLKQQNKVSTNQQQKFIKRHYQTHSYINQIINRYNSTHNKSIKNIQPMKRQSLLTIKKFFQQIRPLNTQQEKYIIKILSQRIIEQIMFYKQSQVIPQKIDQNDKQNPNKLTSGLQKIISQHKVCECLQRKLKFY